MPQGHVHLCPSAINPPRAHITLCRGRWWSFFTASLCVCLCKTKWHVTVHWTTYLAPRRTYSTHPAPTTGTKIVAPPRGLPLPTYEHHMMLEPFTEPHYDSLLIHDQPPQRIQKGPSHRNDILRLANAPVGLFLIIGGSRGARCCMDGAQMACTADVRDRALQDDSSPRAESRVPREGCLGSKAEVL